MSEDWKKEIFQIKKINLTYDRFLDDATESPGIVGPLEDADVVKVNTLLHRVHGLLIWLPEQGSVQFDPHEALQNICLLPRLEGEETNTHTRSQKLTGHTRWNVFRLDIVGWLKNRLHKK